MKISVIIPVYNEEKDIPKAIKALLDQKYPRLDFEIIIIDDGSIDNTLKVLKKYPVRVVALKKNAGRLKARQKGARAAKFENLLFIDTRCLAQKNLLSTLKKINYQPLIGNILWREPKNRILKVLTLIKSKIFGRFYTGNYQPTKINRRNFDQIPKGTGVFFCNKQLFLKSQPKKLLENTKDASDDTKLFRQIVSHKPILKHPAPKAWRIFREDSHSVIKHLYNRGPKFVDYYFRPGRRFYPLFYFYLIFLILTIVLLCLNINWFLWELLILTVIYLIISIYMADNFRDFFWAISYLWLILIIFGAGVIKGIILKTIRLVKTKSQKLLNN